MMKRFMVTGKRLDNGETVTGFFCHPTYPGSNWYIAVEREGKVVYVKVDPASVEPRVSLVPEL